MANADDNNCRPSIYQKELSVVCKVREQGRHVNVVGTRCNLQACNPMGTVVSNRRVYGATHVWTCSYSLLATATHKISIDFLKQVLVYMYYIHGCQDSSPCSFGLFVKRITSLAWLQLGKIVLTALNLLYMRVAWLQLGKIGAVHVAAWGNADSRFPIYSC